MCWCVVGGAREGESRERPQEGENSIVVSAYFPSPLRLDITGHTTAFLRTLPHMQIKKKKKSLHTFTRRYAERKATWS